VAPENFGERNHQGKTPISYASIECNRYPTKIMKTAWLCYKTENFVKTAQGICPNGAIYISKFVKFTGSGAYTHDIQKC